MPAKDRQRMADFYAKTFGWQMQMFGEEMGNYVLVSTTETDDKGNVKTPGAINGGFFERTDDNTAPSVVIGVDDINAHVKKVTDAGGKVLNEPIEIPGIGWYASFIDPEGNRVSMLQGTG
jgi:predicted enzyme related to lactoylglutathione lyase